MHEVAELHTERLVLREWRDDDLPLFAAINSDPVVMEFFPKVLTHEESDERARIAREHFATHGYGLWAVEVRGGDPFVGFVGLSHPWFDFPFEPRVEVGWRLARLAWGHGYATEAARAAIAFGFQQIGLEEIVSFTVPNNLRSRRVMERLGMTRDPAEDFNHPKLPEGHPLCRHVLYRLSRNAFLRVSP